MTPHQPRSGWTIRSGFNDSASLEGVNPAPLREGPDLLRESLESLDGTRSFVINVGIGDKFLYTVESTSPTKWAYANPDSPELPAEYLLLEAERERRYELTEGSLEYAAEFVSNNPDALKFVDADGVVALFTSDDYWDVDDDELEQMALWLLHEWNGAPPNWVYDGADFYSLSDAFALLAARAAGEPSAGLVSNVYGPWSAVVSQAAATTVSGGALRSAADAGLIRDGRIQETYDIDGQTLSATQVLYSLAYLYVLDRHSEAADAIEVPVTATSPDTFGLLETLGCMDCQDSAWSLKPARFQHLSAN